MIPTHIQAMHQALHALENHSGNYKLNKRECIVQESAIDALSAAIKQAQKVDDSVNVSVPPSSPNYGKDEPEKRASHLEAISDIQKFTDHVFMLTDNVRYAFNRNDLDGSILKRLELENFLQEHLTFHPVKAPDVTNPPQWVTSLECNLLKMISELRRDLAKAMCNKPVPSLTITKGERHDGWQQYDINEHSGVIQVVARMDDDDTDLPLGQVIEQFLLNPSIWPVEPSVLSKKLLTIIAHAYQIAGAYGAPSHILDVLSDPIRSTQAQIDGMLPFVPVNEQRCEEVPTNQFVQPVPDRCDRIIWRNRYYHLPMQLSGWYKDVL